MPRVSRPVFLLVLAAVAFSTSAPLARLASTMPPPMIACLRCAVAASVILLVRGRETLSVLHGLRRRGPLIGAGALLAAHFGLFTAGLVTTSLPAAVALVALEPLAVVVAAWAAFGIRPRPAEAAGIAVATVGALFVGSGSGTGEHKILGDLLVLLAVAFFGGYVAIARGLRDTMPVLPYAAAVYGVAALLLAPVALATATSAAPVPRDWIAVLALGLVPTLVGHTLLQNAARTASPAVVALVSPGETLGSLAIGAALMGAWPTGREAIGAALVITGAVIAVRAQGSVI